MRNEVIYWTGPEARAYFRPDDQRLHIDLGVANVILRLTTPPRKEIRRGLWMQPASTLSYSIGISSWDSPVRELHTGAPGARMEAVLDEGEFSEYVETDGASGISGALLLQAPRKMGGWNVNWHPTTQLYRREEGFILTVQASEKAVPSLPELLPGNHYGFEFLILDEGQLHTLLDNLSA